MQRFAGLNSIEGWNLTLQLSSLSNDNNNNKGGLDFSYPPVYNLIKKGNQMQDLMPSVKFNFFLC